jgi:predicted amidohydrolase YtcJ
MKSRHSRREFAGLIAGASTALVSPPWFGHTAFAAESSDPDLVVFNARIYTVDPLTPRAEAFAVKAGRFTAVGSSEQIKSLAGGGTRTYDAQQMTIVPGFIDAHNHAPGAILLYEVLVGNPYDVEFVTIESIVEKLRARARETPPGTWVEGYFFDDTKVKDNRTLTIHDLDQVSHEHPVAVRHRGGHTSYYNSKAFELAGVTRNTPDSEAGTFDRDANGDLNGRVTDRARNVFNNVGKRPTTRPKKSGAATATRWLSSPNSSSAMGSPACTTKAAISPRSRRCARAATSCTG